MNTISGQKLDDRYELLEVVGQGGMATVYKARDQILGRPVAVKVLHPQFAQHPEFLVRFMREAQSAASLIHPNIVTVYDTGKQDDTHYIVMEYIQGRQIKELIREQGPLPIELALDVTRQVAEALAYAHKREIVHRDIKPHNIMVCAEGRVRVTDFGIAKAMSQAGLTQDGAVMGTVQYIAPEQARGEMAGPQSDIYSLGICLFEMITGLQPFRGDNPVEIAMRQVSEELPPLTRHGEPVNGRLAEIVAKATAKDRSVRYADAAAMSQDLQEAIAGQKVTEAEAQEKTRVLRALKRPKKPAKQIGEERTRLTAAVPQDPSEKRGARFVAWSILAALVIIVGLVAFTALMVKVVPRVVKPTTAPQTVTAVKPARLTPIGADDYDPQGSDGSEDADHVSEAFDGDPTTAWHTDLYNTEQFGNLKTGVGLYFDMGKAEVSSVRISAIESGWNAEIRGANEVPDTIDGWAKLAERAGVSETSSFNLKRAKYRYILVWITKLAPDPNGDRSRVDISEVLFYGRKL